MSTCAMSPAISEVCVLLHSQTSQSRVYTHGKKNRTHVRFRPLVEVMLRRVTLLN